MSLLVLLLFNVWSISLSLYSELKKLLQERDMQLETERAMREEAEARAEAAEEKVRRFETAPTQSPTQEIMCGFFINTMIYVPCFC